MLKKSKIKKEIRKIEKQIEAIEKKRIRSQAALVEAILTHQTPDDKDTDYFNKYTAEINELRDEMQELKLSLQSM